MRLKQEKDDHDCSVAFLVTKWTRQDGQTTSQNALLGHFVAITMGLNLLQEDLKLADHESIVKKKVADR